MYINVCLFYLACMVDCVPPVSDCWLVIYLYIPDTSHLLGMMISYNMANMINTYIKTCI
jgi:hypothetical protein